MDQRSKPARYERKPNHDFTAKLSRDGRFFIFKETTTYVVPRKYLDVITQNHISPQMEPVVDSAESKPPKKGKRNADSNGQRD
jgi:hypothetical protein